MLPSQIAKEITPILWGYKTNQDLHYLQLLLNLQQGYSITRHGLLVWGYFEEREK